MTGFLTKIVAQKRTEIAAAKRSIPIEQLKSQLKDAPPVRDFFAALSGFPEVRLIAEVKKASPSKGLIRELFDPVSIARAYENAGAACVSVLTDQRFFQGNLDYLRSVRQNVEIPVLRKDFVLDEYQVTEARVAGADAVLLIAECLDPFELSRLNDLVIELGMTPLIELFGEDELPKVLNCDPRLIGINNRDLNSFVTNVNHTFELQKLIDDSILLVSESGIESNDDVCKLGANGIGAMLVGESLMRQDNIEMAVKRLLGISDQ